MAVLVASALAPGEAHAGPYAMLGYDAETMGLANSQMAIGRSLGVLHNNPALMPLLADQTLLGLSMVAPHLEVTLFSKPGSTDVPISIYDSDVGTLPGLQDRALPTSELVHRRTNTRVSNATAALTSGFASSFGIKDLRVGAILLLPIAGAGAARVTTHYDDEREAAFSNRVAFTRFGQWDELLSVVAGAGYAVEPWLSVGVAFEIAASAQASIDVYIPDAAVQDYSQSNFDVQVSTKFRPIVGVRAAPLDWLSLGMSFRAETFYEVQGDTVILLWNSHEPDANKTIPKRSNQKFPAVFGYEPLEVSLGVAAEGGPVTGHLTATFQRWSSYLDGHGERPEDVAQFPPSPFAKPVIDGADFAFSDVVNVQGGAALRLTKMLEVSVGGAYHPTPVPAQIGRTSYADADVVSVTAGQRVDFTAFERKFAVSLGLSFSHMMSRTTYKDPALIVDELPDSSRTLEGDRPMSEAAGLQTNNPGFPGYEAGGDLFAGSLSLSHAF